MKRTDLEELGLEKETIDKILKLHGLATEEKKTALEKAESDLEAVKGELETANSQLEEANKKIASFSDMKTPEDVDAAIAEWKEKAAQAKIDADKRVADIEYDSWLKESLSSKDANGVGQARNVKATSALLDGVALRESYEKSKDAALALLKEQAAGLLETDGYLWDTGEDEPEFTGQNRQSRNINQDALTTAMREAAGLDNEKD